MSDEHKLQIVLGVLFMGLIGWAMWQVEKDND